MGAVKCWRLALDEAARDEHEGITPAGQPMVWTMQAPDGGACRTVPAGQAAALMDDGWMPVDVGMGS